MHDHPPHHVPEPGEPSVPEIEVDENVAPRPEEEAADIARATPDTADHTHTADHTQAADHGPG